MQFSFQRGGNSCRCCPPCPPPPPPPPSGVFTAIKRSRATGRPVAGAVYTLYQSGRPVARAESDAAGRLRFAGLQPGCYTLSETEAPAGYQPDATSYTVSVCACGRVTIDCQPADGFPLYDTPAATLAFQKRDEVNGRPLSGAVFTLSNGQTATSDSNGLVQFGTLAPGTYTLTETRAPDGYQLSDTPYTVTVSAAGAVTVNGVPIEQFTAWDAPMPSFFFYKTDARTGEPLSGAVFTLSNGQTATSDSDGLVQFGRLAPGTYTLTETTAPSGYAPNTQTYTVVVSATGEITVNGTAQSEFSVANTRNAYPLSFPKADLRTGEPLSGAVFTLSNGQTATSDSDGRVTFGPLTPGTYTLTETTAPAGYLPNTQTYTVVVSSTGTVTVDGDPAAEFTVYNTPQPAFFLRKYDARTGEPLPGAVFTLSNGQTATSDSDGLVQFGPLTPGTYTLTETRAPEGYLPNTQTYTVVVSATGEITINGDPMGEFYVGNSPSLEPSDPPTIEPITAGDTLIVGEGVPGAQIVATLPDGVQLTTTVNDGGIWLIPVPTGTTLSAGQTVTARQTVPGSGQSEPAAATVRAAG